MHKGLYKHKYQKYKIKYLLLKNQIAGANCKKKKISNCEKHLTCEWDNKRNVCTNSKCIKFSKQQCKIHGLECQWTPNDQCIRKIPQPLQKTPFDPQPYKGITKKDWRKAQQFFAKKNVKSRILKKTKSSGDLSALLAKKLGKN